MKMLKENFEKLAMEALRELPERFKEKLENIDVVIEKKPSKTLLLERGIKSMYSLLGLYHGVPLRRRGHYYANVLPDKITLFQEPIESSCQTEEELPRRVREVLIHEIGHYFGLSEKELR